MVTQALLVVVWWLTLGQALEDHRKSVNSLVLTDNISEESAPRLYRSAPAGVYASAVPYASFSFNVPNFVAAPKAASSQLVPVKQEAAAVKNNQGYLRDSYGNKFVGSPQTMAYKATFPQQYVQLQDLPVHLSQPLVAPSFQVPHYFYGSPYKVASFQSVTPAPFRYSAFPEPLVYAEKIKSITTPFHSRTFGAPQQQSSNNRQVYASSPVYGYYKKIEPQFQRLEHKNVVYGFNYGHNNNQLPLKDQKDKAQPETAQAKQTIVTTLANGKQAVIQLDTKPPVPLLDLSLLEPLTFANPIVPQVQHFLPKINSVTYHKLPELDDVEEIKKHQKEFVVQKTKSYDSRERPQGDGANPQPNKPAQPQEVIIHHEKTLKNHNVKPVVTIASDPNDGNEFSYEINSPNYKETYNEQVVKYNKETKPEPKHYSYNMKSENEPVTYSYSHTSQDPAQIKQAPYKTISHEPKHLIYTFSPEEHITETDEHSRPSTRSENDNSRTPKDLDPEVLVHILENDDLPANQEISQQSEELSNDPDVHVKILESNEQHRESPKSDYHERPEYREQEYTRQPKQEIRHDSENSKSLKSHNDDEIVDNQEYYPPTKNQEIHHESINHRPSKPAHHSDEDEYHSQRKQEIQQSPKHYRPSKHSHHNDEDEYRSQRNRENHRPSAANHHDEENYRPHTNQETRHNSEHHRSPPLKHHNNEDYHPHSNQDIRNNADDHRSNHQSREENYYPRQEIRHNSEHHRIVRPKHHSEDNDYHHRPNQEIHHDVDHHRSDKSQHYQEKFTPEHRKEENYREDKQDITHKPKHYQLENLNDEDTENLQQRTQNQKIHKDVENFNPQHYSQHTLVPRDNFEREIEAATPGYEEDIRVLPVHRSHSPIKVDPSQHIQHSKSSSEENDDDSSSPSEEAENIERDRDHEPLNHSPPRSNPPPNQHILEKSKSIIIQEETPHEMHSLREQMVAEMIKEEENNEEDFEKSYKNAAYGFPAYEGKSEEEKDLYNPETYGATRYTGEFEVDNTPFQNYQAQGDQHPRSSRLNYKDAIDKTKEDYYSEFAVSKPESDKERYEKKEDYYKTYMNHRPEKLFSDENDDRREYKKEKYTASPSYEYKPSREQKKKPYFAEYKAIPQRYAYGYPKEKSQDNNAHDTRPYQRFVSKTQFVEPQFQYGFEPISIPRLLDSELAAMASNDSPESETPGTRKKIYKENWYIKKTSTGNNAAS